MALWKSGGMTALKNGREGAAAFFKRVGRKTSPWELDSMRGDPSAIRHSTGLVAISLQNNSAGGPGK